MLLNYLSKSVISENLIIETIALFTHLKVTSLHGHLIFTSHMTFKKQIKLKIIALMELNIYEFYMNSDNKIISSFTLIITLFLTLSSFKFWKVAVGIGRAKCTSWKLNVHHDNWSKMHYFKPIPNILFTINIYIYLNHYSILWFCSQYG